MSGYTQAGGSQVSPTQIENLQVGDLVKFGANVRKVRAISDNAGMKRSPRYRRVYSVTFAILRRSWTNRPYTIYSYCDLRAGHIKLVKRGVRLRTTKNERLVQKMIDDERQRSYMPGEYPITAAQMVGTVI